MRKFSQIFWMMNNPKLIAIVGGSGFIGTRLTRQLLDKGKSVRIIDKQDSSAYPDLVSIADVRNFDDILRALDGTHTIYHLAAEHKDDVSPASLYYDVNVEGTRNVIAAAQAHDIRQIIFTSSVAVYGLNKEEPDERSPVDPFGDYGKSKWQAEELLRAWQSEDSHRHLTIVRPVVVFGEGNRGNVYNLLRQIVSGRFAMVGSGNNYKSMAYVENVAGFLCYLNESWQGYQLYNYADKPDWTMTQLVHFIYDEHLRQKPPAFRLPYRLALVAGYFGDGINIFAGNRFPITSTRIRKFCATTQFNSSRSLQSSFTPLFSLHTALLRTLQTEFPQD
jgi:nucleoside-diphosphate-sugar epimerase